MTTHELHVTPKIFGPLFDGDRRTLTVTDPTVAAGNHVVVQEYAGSEFTGRWIRCRVSDVETQPGDCAAMLILQQIARSRAPALRRRAA